MFAQLLGSTNLLEGEKKSIGLALIVRGQKAPERKGNPLTLSFPQSQ